MNRRKFPWGIFAVLSWCALFPAAAGSVPARGGSEPTAGELALLAGTWSGHGAGEEVRFRDKNGLLTLTVKHKTEFVFHVDENGRIAGEGTIEYGLEKNTSGLDDLVAGVHALMGLAQVPSTGVQGPRGDLAKKIGEHATDVKGVTKIQYDAPHLKHGPEVRHFKFTGTIRRGTHRNREGKEAEAFLMTLDDVLNFTRMGGEPDNTLVAEYEVNRVKTEADFPCWSPFIEGAGVVRRGPGDIHVAEFQQQGSHRQGKRVWEEYGYVWLARQVAPAEK
ncbi:MAG: hypothetical protein JXO51_11000 [Candidatus Aminicenantes bacterium]|nr:hypothetical protein [Candidatus Aminicenantes bacterium]